MTDKEVESESRFLCWGVPAFLILIGLVLWVWTRIDPCLIDRWIYRMSTYRNGMLQAGGNSLVDEGVVFWWNPACNGEMP